MKILEKNILKIVSEVCNVSERQIIRRKGSKRSSNLVLARQILVNILWRNFNYTNFMVRDILRYKNHASVVHCRKMHETDYEYNPEYRKYYNRVSEKLGLYISDEDLEVMKNLDLSRRIEKQEEEIVRYKNMWIVEKTQREKYQQELITFKKKYIPNKHN